MDVLDELERLSKAATPDRWVVQNSIFPNQHMKSLWTSAGKWKGIEIGDSLSVNEAELIAAMRNNIEALIKVARAARDVVSGDVEHWRDVIGALAQLERGE